MRTTLTYGSSFDLIITTTTHGVFTHEMPHCSLQEAIDYCESIFCGDTPIWSSAVSMVTVCDAHTGEICAECQPDFDLSKTSFENPNYYFEDIDF